MTDANVAGFERIPWDIGGPQPAVQADHRVHLPAWSVLATRLD
ncbi:hypothetical protein [Mycobacterium sp. HNNTM2301]